MNIFDKMVEVGFALKSSNQHFRAFHVAGIFKKNKLVSLGINQKKTHPFAFKNGYPWASEGIHAECLAVIKGGLDDYSNYSLVVLRIDNNNKLNLSRPCKFCSLLLTKLNFSSIFYTDGHGNFVKI